MRLRTILMAAAAGVLDPAGPLLAPRTSPWITKGGTLWDQV